MLEINFPNWMITDRGTRNRFSLNLFNGSVYFRVSTPNDRGQATFRRSIKRNKLAYVVQAIKRTMASSPETKIPCKFNIYDKQSNQSRLDWVITFELDSKRCFKIHLTDCQTNQTYVFAVRGTMDVTIGSDNMQECDRSKMEMEDLLSWFESVRIWAPATCQPYSPNGKGGGKQGGGNYNKQNGGGGYQNNNGSNGGGGYGGDGGGDPDNLPF